MARFVKKIGDVFAAKLDDDSRKYIQYMGNDSTELGSDVIKAFKRVYPVESEPDLSEVVRGEVEFYAHCVLKWGIQQGLWEKVGHVSELGSLDILFRSTPDWMAPPGKMPSVSRNWRVWRMNEPWHEVDRLEDPYRQAEIGLVIAPQNIVARLRTGEYGFEYPGFE